MVHETLVLKIVSDLWSWRYSKFQPSTKYSMWVQKLTKVPNLPRGSVICPELQKPVTIPILLLLSCIELVPLGQGWIPLMRNLALPLICAVTQYRTSVLGWFKGVISPWCHYSGEMSVLMQVCWGFISILNFSCFQSCVVLVSRWIFRSQISDFLPALPLPVPLEAL